MEYYCALAGVQEEIFFGEESPVLVRNSLLDGTLPGYSVPVDMLVYERQGQYIVSCSGRGAGFLLTVEDNEGCEKMLRSRPCSLKFYYAGSPAAGDSEAVRLSRENYPDFEEFYRQRNPGCGEAEWLEDYFCSISDRGFCYGIYRDGHLVSVSDSPELPILGDRFCEVGINTLPGFRRQGLAETICRAVIGDVISRGYVPLWSAGEGNTASICLAEKLGFVRLMRTAEISLR